MSYTRKREKTEEYKTWGEDSRQSKMEEGSDEYNGWNCKWNEKDGKKSIKKIEKETNEGWDTTKRETKGKEKSSDEERKEVFGKILPTRKVVRNVIFSLLLLHHLLWSGKFFVMKDGRQELRVTEGRDRNVYTVMLRDEEKVPDTTKEKARDIKFVLIKNVFGSKKESSYITIQFTEQSWSLLSSIV